MKGIINGFVGVRSRKGGGYSKQGLREKGIKADRWVARARNSDRGRAHRSFIVERGIALLFIAPPPGCPRPLPARLARGNSEHEWRPVRQRDFHQSGRWAAVTLPRDTANTCHRTELQLTRGLAWNAPPRTVAQGSASLTEPARPLVIVAQRNIDLRLWRRSLPLPRTKAS